MVPNLAGPFAFNDKTIDATITVTSPGVYMLGYTGTNATLYVERVGRSDVNLNARLKSDEYRGRFREFKAAYCPDATTAFHHECTLWHAYGGTLNPNHPATPANQFLLVCVLCPKKR